MTSAFSGRALQLLVFDFDGVLVSTSPCHAQAYRELWQRIGVESPAYETIAGRKTVDVIAELAAPVRPDPAQIDTWTAEKQRRARELIESADICFPDTQESLRGFAALGLPMALGTCASAATVESTLARYGMADCFSRVMTAEDVRNGKPDPEIYRTIIAQQAVDPAATLIIEDSAAGIQAALDANALVVSVRSGEMADADGFVGAYDDLASLLADMAGAG